VTCRQAALVEGRDLEPSQPVILKMDVEGHDDYALRGLSRFLERRELALICEVSRHNLSRVGSTPEELFRMMKDREFGAFRFDVDQSRRRRSLRLTPLEGPHPGEQPESYKVFFIRPGTTRWHRLDHHRPFKVTCPTDRPGVIPLHQPTGEASHDS
jgi:hypothetical protein